MKVEILYFEGCPNYKPAFERLRRVIRQEGISADVREIEVPNEAAAKKLGFVGSPTIRVDGVDIEPAFRSAQGTGLACRLYPGGLPSTELIQTALREAQGKENMNPAQPNSPAERPVSRGARTAVASVAAIGSVLAASSCCLPILPFVFAAGAAGGSAFLTALRPYLLALSVVFVAYGFYQASRAKRCRTRPGVVSSVLLWSSAVFVVVSILFPQMLADAAANLLAW